MACIPEKPSPSVRTAMGKTAWKALLRLRTWMSVWYTRAASATTDASTRRALIGASASRGTCCKRTPSRVYKVKTKKHQSYFVTMTFPETHRKAVSSLMCNLQPTDVKKTPFVYTFTLYYFPVPFEFLPFCKAWYSLIIIILFLH